ncbi:hypothetical protein ACEN2T_17730 [Pseudomonas sp. W22_MBD1_FP4]|uniref:hypothetical protein n=1 Tax=Pseudomonas sp. W22_MBD1_FP4 TaxID=3240272 RepID=UPI003F9B4FD5
MIESMDDSQAPLNDAQVAAGARPGESWEQARERLRVKAHSTSALNGIEWQRFMHMVDDIQRMCIKSLHDTRGSAAGLLLIQIQQMFEYCSAIADGLQVELLPQVLLRYGLFDEAYAQLSRLNPEEAKWTPEIFVGLLDVLGHPAPYENLMSLEEEGCLKMVLSG